MNKRKLGSLCAHQDRLVGWTRGGKRSDFNQIIDYNVNEVGDWVCEVEWMLVGC